jgi:hypothetical protein
MKKSVPLPTAEYSDLKSSQKLGQPRIAVIPSGFHPLSKKMVDVLVAMQKQFFPYPDWWRQGALIRKLTMDYYQALRQVLRESSPSQRLLVRCCHCDIFF